MFKIVSKFLILLSTTFAFASAPNCGVPLTIEQAIQQSNTIIEGYITQAECFEKEHQIYTKYTLHPTKLFKGTTEGSISIVELGGSLNGISVQSAGVNHCHVGLHGVFFLTSNGTTSSYTSNPIAYHSLMLNPVATGFNRSYTSIEEVYQHLNALGLNPTLLDPSYHAEQYVKQEERKTRSKQLLMQGTKKLYPSHVHLLLNCVGV